MTSNVPGTPLRAGYEEDQQSPFKSPEYLKESALLLKLDMDLIGRRVEQCDDGILNLTSTINTARHSKVHLEIRLVVNAIFLQRMLILHFHVKTKAVNPFYLQHRSRLDYV